MLKIQGASLKTRKVGRARFRWIQNTCIFFYRSAAGMELEYKTDEYANRSNVFFCLFPINDMQSPPPPTLSPLKKKKLFSDF